MLTIKDRLDLIANLENLVTKCEGVMMAAKGGSYLHNFAFSIQEDIRQIAFGIENGGIGQDGDND